MVCLSCCSFKFFSADCFPMTPLSYPEGFPESVSLQYKSILNKSQAKRNSPILIFSLIVKNRNWSDLFVLQKEVISVYAILYILYMQIKLFICTACVKIFLFRYWPPSDFFICVHIIRFNFKKRLCVSILVPLSASHQKFADANTNRWLKCCCNNISSLCTYVSTYIIYCLPTMGIILTRVQARW